MSPSVHDPAVAPACEGSTDAGAHEARILIVHPMPAQVRPLEGLLRSAGYTRVCDSHPAGSGAPPRAPFDLVLLHLSLPDPQGFDALARLLDERGGGPPPPVLAITTGPGEPWLALQAGARDCISAPFDPLELLARMHHLLQAQRAHRALLAHQHTLERRLQQRTDDWLVSTSRSRALTALLTHPGPTVA